MLQPYRPSGYRTRRAERAASRAWCANARYHAAMKNLMSLEQAFAGLPAGERDHHAALLKARREFEASFKACCPPRWGHQRGLSFMASDLEACAHYGLPTRGLAHMWWQARCYLRGFLGR